MYRSNGNFDAYATPLTPEGLENKRAYFVGSGLAGLAGATFLIRDAGMSGDRITIYEELALPSPTRTGRSRRR